MKIVECVPNFSEGRNQETLEAIKLAIQTVKGVSILDIDPGEATNRTVFTFVGQPEPVLEAAFVAIKKAAELIDMTTHTGAHARQGATDVCPFVPVANMSMDECVALANKLGERVGEELSIPVYLYEYAAKSPKRKLIQNIRAGEYEALAEKLTKPEWKPDYGPATFNAKSGATVIGAREFLIAYNININSKDKKLAKEISLEIRDTGRFQRDEQGKRIQGDDGTWLRKPGRLQNCKATGWYIEDYDTAQVTMNLTNYHITPIHAAFDAVCEEAYKLGLRVTGSEIVGLIPKDALYSAGLHYLKKQGSTTGVSEKEILTIAVRSMGLNDVAPFDIEKKIIEYQLPKSSVNLTGMKIPAFIDELASNSPAPGGGSVAALSGSLSAALSAMVAALTFEKKGFEEQQSTMEELGCKAQNLKNTLLHKIDQDTEAFNSVMNAMRLPKKTDEEQKLRLAAIEEANQYAATVPLEVLELCTEAMTVAEQAVKQGNPASVSDAGVAGLMAHAGAQGAYYNVLINIKEMQTNNWKSSIQERAAKAIQKADAIAVQLRKTMETNLQA